MKQKLQYTLLLIEFAIRTIWVVWTVNKTIVTWDRKWKTITFTVDNLKPEDRTCQE